MGGNAFNRHDPPLPTPRMPPDIYKQILEQTLATLRQHYENVGSPVEAPGKPTFGDIDIMVSTPLFPSFKASQKCSAQRQLSWNQEIQP